MKTPLALVALLAACAANAAPVVDNVSVSQAADRTVTVSYRLTGAPAIVTFDVLKGGASLNPTNLWSVWGDVNRKMSADGTYSFKWSPDGLGDEFDLHGDTLEFQVKANELADPPMYMVVDLSTNTPTHEYDIRYYNAAEYLPGGILSNVAYRTSKLVMRRIYATGVTANLWNGTDKTTEKYPEHSVTFDQDYYIAVFELTQAQYRFITGLRRDKFMNTTTYKDTTFAYEGDWAMRPISKVSFETFRGGTDFFYPEAPSPTSPLGKLRTMSGLDFDLPSEARWEFACRAGHYEKRSFGNGTTFTSANDYSANANCPGRNMTNGGRNVEDKTLNWTVEEYHTLGATNGTAIVGSFAPSDWGLYDMHGNVAEFTLDFVTNPTDAPFVTGYEGADKGAPNCNGLKLMDGSDPYYNGNAYCRIVRGGGFNAYPLSCQSGARATAFANGRVYFGFRVILPIEQEEKE